MVTIGIIGAGYTIGISKSHAKAYLQCSDAKITAVYDILPGRAQDLIDTMGLKDAKACQSLEELFDLCEAVSICTPNSTHVPLSIAALKAGKHVLCEKPFAPTPDECDKAIQAAKSTNLTAMIGLCYRDIPGFVYLKKLLDEGVFGKIFFVREEQGGPRIASPEVKLEWRMQETLSGPGALADFGSHMMDICDYLLRPSCGKIRTIQAMRQTYIEERERIDCPGEMGKVTNDDVACWSCCTEKGTLYNFTASRIGCMFMLEIVGEGGRAVFNGARPLELELQLKDKNGGYTGPSQIVPVPEECCGDVGREFSKNGLDYGFYYEIRQFLDSIQSGKKSLLTFERGKYIQQLIETAKISADTGKAVTVEA